MVSQMLGRQRQELWNKRKLMIVMFSRSFETLYDRPLTPNTATTTGVYQLEQKWKLLHHASLVKKREELSSDIGSHCRNN